MSPKTDSGYGDMPLFSLLGDQHSGSGKRKLSEEDLERMIFGQVVSKGSTPKLSVLPTAGMPTIGSRTITWDLAL